MTKKNEVVANTENIAPAQEVIQVPEVVTSVDYVAQGLEPILKSGLSDNERWAMILQLAEAHVDESALPLDKVSDGEIVRRLRLLWSKRVALKKTLENAKTVEDAEKAQTALDELQVTEDEMNSYRTGKGARHGGGVVKTDIAPELLKDDQLELSKLIRNLQSKKSIAKKAGDDATVKDMEARIAEAVKYRTTSPTTAKTQELNSKIAAALQALQLLPPSEEINVQIEALKKLL
jgi:hypothetical protein